LKWPVVSLSDALASAEVFVDGDWVESKDQDPEGDVRLVQLADVGDGEYIDKSDRFLTSVKARELRCTYLKPGDVMVARMPDPLGRACIFPGDLKPAVTVVDVCVIRPDDREHDARWLMHCLNAPACRNQIAGYATGTTRSRISRGNLGKIKIPLPPLAEQLRIAEVLDRAEALRAKRRAALTQLDSLTQSLFLDLFGNPIHNERKWPRAELREMCRVERGKFTPRPRGDPSYYGGRFPFIQTGDISSSGGRLNTWSQTLNEKGVTVSRSFPPDTVVIAIVGATLGITAILDIEVYCPDSVVGIQAHASKASPEYIERVLRFWRPIFVAQAPETARANINLETLRPLKVPRPPIELQREFARRVGAVEKLKTAQRTSLAELNALFASLQHRAFRGEL